MAVVSTDAFPSHASSTSAVASYAYSHPPQKKYWAQDEDKVLYKRINIVIPDEPRLPDSTFINYINETWQDSSDRLSAYSLFDFGWDGYHGRPFSRENILLFRKALKKILVVLTENEVLPNKFSVGASGDGSLALEMKIDNRFFIITLENDKTFNFYDHDISDKLIPFETLGEEFNRSIVEMAS